MKRAQSGVTLIELLITISVAIMVVFGLIGLGFMGNCWYTESGVERQIMAEKTGVTKVIKTTRNIFAYSRVLVKEDGTQKTYCLNSNILANYTFLECD